jgi:hypothetical protein
MLCSSANSELCGECIAFAACTCQVSDKELFDQVAAGAMPVPGHATFVAQRAELLLQAPARLGLRTR